jgi:hypothetical protein
VAARGRLLGHLIAEFEKRSGTPFCLVNILSRVFCTIVRKPMCMTRNDEE